MYCSSVLIEVVARKHLERNCWTLVFLSLIIWPAYLCTLFTLVYALLHVGAVVVLVEVLDGQEGVEKYVKKCETLVNIGESQHEFLQQLYNSFEKNIIFPNYLRNIS